MAPEQLDGFSLAFPLLHDESQNVEDMEYSSTGCKLDLGSTSFFKTCFNGLNALLGIGILSVPYALASGGWLSLMLLFVIALATFYTGLLLQRCMDVDLNIRTYPDIGAQAFGKKGRLMVSIFMYLELYLVATGFLILEGDNLHNLFPMEGFEIFGQVIDGRQSFILISGLVILPSQPVFCCITILGSILWTGVFDGVGFQWERTTLNWKGIPTAFSLYALCYCAHPVFPSLYTSMRKKTSLACAAMAVLGYLKFGSEVQSQITLNLPIEKLSSRVAIYTTLVNPISKYALMVAPIVNATENWFPNYCNRRSFSLLIRTALVFSTIIHFRLYGFMLLPCLCYLKISGIYHKLGIELVIMIGVMLMGTSAGIMGTYTS
ncbi:hypothetical protein AAG906_019892 [Vitis piasezkii]